MNVQQDITVQIRQLSRHAQLDLNVQQDQQLPLIVRTTKVMAITSQILISLSASTAQSDSIALLLQLPFLAQLVSTVIEK